MSQLARALVVSTLALALAGCSGGLILANPPLVLPVPPTPGPTAPRVTDPEPIVFPRDDGPHDRLTEWWYFTGHLQSQDGDRYGFEAVIFRAERGDVPVSWASHLAVTDETHGRFLYAQRSEIGATVDHSSRDANGAPLEFGLEVLPSDGTASGGTVPPWVLEGADGWDEITAAFSAAESEAAGGTVELSLRSTPWKPPVLHNTNGWVPFGPAGGSYYYSRTGLIVGGELAIDGAEKSVSGSAWFDHQWGDFISVGGGGWDWFAINLLDNTDLTVSLVRAADGSYPLVYGTFVSLNGAATHLERSDFRVTSTGTWTSPHTGAIYPSGWRIEVPSRDLVIDLAPTVKDQELDTRATTGVVYWEGSQRVRATVAGELVPAEAYVELTGYMPPISGAIPSPP